MQGAMTLGTLIVSLTLIHEQHLPVIPRLYDESLFLFLSLSLSCFSAFVHSSGFLFAAAVVCASGVVIRLGFLEFLFLSARLLAAFSFFGIGEGLPPFFVSPSARTDRWKWTIKRPTIPQGIVCPEKTSAACRGSMINSSVRWYITRDPFFSFSFLFFFEQSLPDSVKIVNCFLPLHRWLNKFFTASCRVSDNLTLVNYGITFISLV